MRLKIIILICSFLILVSCSVQGDKLTGSWQASIMGYTQIYTFNGDGTGVFQSSLGTTAINYEIINDNQIRIAEIKAKSNNQGEVYEYQLVNKNVLIINEITHIKIS